MRVYNSHDAQPRTKEAEQEPQEDPQNTNPHTQRANY